MGNKDSVSNSKKQFHAQKEFQLAKGNFAPGTSYVGI